MSTEGRTLTSPVPVRAAAGSARPRDRPPAAPIEDFEQIYLRHVDVVMGYFARRCGDPQTVADLTSETWVRAIDGYRRFDSRRGSHRAWVLGIAHHVFAAHCEQWSSHREARARLEGHRVLEEDEIEELARRIDAERDGAALMARCAALPDLERAALELVDLEELTPKEAARALGVSRVALRKRLSRARARVRKDLTA